MKRTKSLNKEQIIIHCQTSSLTLSVFETVASEIRVPRSRMRARQHIHESPLIGRSFRLARVEFNGPFISISFHYAERDPLV